MPSVSSQRAAVLGSWKEIAAYLGKGVRTVQRWERQFGLPVRRPNGRREGIVYATREELDAWLVNGWGERTKRPGNGGAAHEQRIQVVRAEIQTSRELLLLSHQLRESLRRSADALMSQCKVMDEQLCKLYSAAGGDPRNSQTN